MKKIVLTLCLFVALLMFGCAQETAPQESQESSSNSISTTLQYTSLRQAYNIYTNYQNNMESALSILDQLMACCEEMNGAEANELNNRLQNLCDDATDHESVPDELKEIDESARSVFGWVSQGGAYLAASAISASDGNVKEATSDLESATSAINHAKDAIDKTNALMDGK